MNAGAQAATPGGVPIDRLVAELPPAVAELGRDARWEIVVVSPSGTTVWRLVRAGSPDTFLKVAPAAGGSADRLRVEADRLVALGRCLDGVAPSGGTVPLAVPPVLASVTDAVSGEHYLATGGLPGPAASAQESKGDAEALVVALASGLRTLHDLPTDGVAVPAPLHERVAAAADRVAAGAVDPSRFSRLHARYTPAELLGHLRSMLPADAADPVVSHGRPTLDHTMLTGGRVSGYVGLARAGVMDRYHDLAVVARDLADHVSPFALGPFFDAYGLDRPDVLRLDVHLLLDELR